MTVPHPQDDLVEIFALYLLTKATTHDVLAEHAWSLAEERADEHGLTVEDAIANLAYIRPSLVEDSPDESNSEVGCVSDDS